MMGMSMPATEKPSKREKFRSMKKGALSEIEQFMRKMMVRGSPKKKMGGGDMGGHGGH